MSSLSWLMGRDEAIFSVVRPGTAFEALERLRRDVGGFFVGRSVPLTCDPAVHPPINVYERSEEFVLTAELPGVALEEIDLSVDGDRLTLRGERKIELPDGAKAQRRERRVGAFERVLTLPAQADVATIRAVYRGGILIVKVPKAKAAKPRRIPVDTAS